MIEASKANIFAFVLDLAQLWGKPILPKTIAFHFGVQKPRIGFQLVVLFGIGDVTPKGENSL